MPDWSETAAVTGAARCPSCRTLFRVTPHQLAARGGMVRCGQCRAVFRAAAAVELPPALKPRVRRPAWVVPALAAPLLLLVLACAGVFAGRNALLARQPAWRPAFERACRPLGCAVHYARAADRIVLESSEFHAGEAPDTAGFITLIRNTGGLTQDFPDLELTLSDAAGHVLARRRFTPAQYLPAGQDARDGLAPGGEQEVRVRLKLDVPATNYRLLAYYAD